MNYLPIISGGGIGDIIIALAWMEYVIRPLDIPVKFYCQFPQIASYFMPWVEIGGNIRQSEYDKPLFDYYIFMSDMINFKFKDLKNMPDCLKKLYYQWEKHGEDWRHYIDSNPLEANKMAHTALDLGLNRWSLSFYMVNKEYKKYHWQLTEPIDIPNKFITVHDGFDASGYYKFERSTKSWDIKSWIDFVKIFKRHYPDIYVVQLGGVKHRKIQGVDINFAGQLSFENSLRYLKSSLLHIDGDSGLVHARRLFNLQSIVIFGPTNVNYFGYPENVNLAPKFCGDCWWRIRDWMATCMAGHSTPACMDSISALNVFKEVVKIMEG